ncbi:hypothetical protein BDCR2A_01716 [Borrelia duttonii CR2A]|uniref:Uncharacterized protein n=1 Tax=Borrelia duttonii CR2A TaxID=1432657 RepID=W6TG46_9SPIR|nr:hypothetical protein BDCR2A_01716 [Borrelia duttonii CR2A]
MLSFIFYYSFVYCLLVFISKSRIQVKKSKGIKGNIELKGRKKRRERVGGE